MVTARDDDVDELQALNIGVDNYLKKPIRPHILLAHVRALLRRCGGSLITQAPDLQLDESTFSATLKGQSLNLTSGEFEVLHYLHLRSGQVIPRDQLYLDIRGFEYDGLDRSIYAYL
ncbi:MAG: response regulator transcription factor [Oceanospirillaceae bacterium]